METERPTRNVQQIRPAGSPDAAVYAPQRDLVNLFLPMMQELLTSLRFENLGSAAKLIQTQHEITEQQFAQAVFKMAEAVRLFIRDPSIASPADAYKAVDMEYIDDPCQLVVFAKIGMIFTGGFFVALRDVTIRGEESSYDSQLAAMVAAGCALHDRLSSVPLAKPVAVTAADISGELAKERLRIILQLQADLAKVKAALQTAFSSQQEEMRGKEESIAALTQEYERLSIAFKAVEDRCTLQQQMLAQQDDQRIEAKTTIETLEAQRDELAAKVADLDHVLLGCQTACDQAKANLSKSNEIATNLTLVIQRHKLTMERYQKYIPTREQSLLTRFGMAVRLAWAVLWSPSDV